MSLLPWLALALAAPPNKTARVFSVAGKDSGTDRLGNMQVTDDGRLVSGRTGKTGTGFIMDVDSWRLTTFSGCTVVGVGIDDFDTAWFGCADGRLIPKIYFRGELYDVQDADGGAFEVQAPLASGHTATALWLDPDIQQLFLFSHGDTTVEAFTYDPITLADVAPASLATGQANDWEESELVRFNGVTGNSVMITYGTNLHGQFTYFTSGDTVTSAAFATITARGTENCTDWNDSFYALYCLDAQQNQLLEYVGGLNYPFTSLSTLGPFTDPKAVVVSDVEGDSWLGITGGQVQVWELDDLGNVVDPDNPAFEGDPSNDNEIQDGIASESVLFGGGINGNLHVSMAAPWMKNGSGSSFVTQDQDPAGTGDSVSLTFEWDEAVIWTAYLGGDRNNPGPVLTSGELAEDTSETIELVIDEEWAEGENDIFILGEAIEDGLIGHGWLGVDVDNPPSVPTLTAASVSAGESRLELSFQGIDDADLAYYELYISTDEFDPADWETGGPSLGVAPAVNPKIISALPEETVEYEIGPLENGTTYYMAVRAFDTGGKESPMSNVVSGTPEQTYGAAELAGETGGSSCSTSPTTGVLGALGLLGAGLLRRRRGVQALGAAVVAAALVPGTASAQDDEKWWKQDLTPARGNFEIRYGGISMEDPNINRVYDTKPKNLLQVEFGPQILRLFEIDGSLGFFQELDKSRTAGGARSDDRTMLTWYQLSADATFRLHLLDEQPIVPFGRYGWDYVMWNENKVVFGGEEVLRGGNPGSHYALGVNLLLDLLQPGRASLLEARTGINDTWITIEWRRQSIDERSRPWQAPVITGSDLYFSGDIFQVGLKLDY